MVLTKDIIRNTLGDIEVLALTIYGEARGEPVEGQIAVGNVIRNRVAAASFNTTKESYRTICLKEHQFSCWNETDPNKIILFELAEKLISGLKFPFEMRQQVWVAKGIVSGDVKDNTKNAKNYLTRQLFESGHAPKWALTMTPVRFIGSHVFGSAA